MKPCCIFAIIYSLGFTAWGQQNPIVRDSTSTTFSFRDLDIPNPSTVVSMYTYDPNTNRYYYTSKIGEFNINYPVILTPAEFQELIKKESLKAYYKEKIDAYKGLKDGDVVAAKNLIPDLYVNSKFRVGPRQALLSAQNGCKNCIFPCKTREFSMKNWFSTFICFSPPFFVPTSTL